MFQFTHPQGVRCISDKFFKHSSVSIHAPARGAIPPYISRVSNYSFNSRTRKGCDVDLGDGQFHCWVSIHAPARGAILCKTYKRLFLCFNSRTRKGCDTYRHYSHHTIVFQFTHPQGVRFQFCLILIFGVVSIHAHARGAIL